MPFSSYDPRQQLLEDYRSLGVTQIVMLASDGEARAVTRLDLREYYRQHGFEVLYFPVPDMQVPDKAGFRTAVSAAAEALEAGMSIAVHCKAGIGRTGVFAACLAQEVLGLGGRESLDWVRQFIPGAVETADQEAFVIDFED